MNCSCLLPTAYCLLLAADCLLPTADHMDEFPTYLLLCLSAFVAGAINSVAGGGTLLTFPALMGVVTPVQANATSTLALMPGSLAGAWGYRRELKNVRRMVLWLLPPSLIGGYLGALLVTEFPERVFERLVPWLILAAAVLFLIQKPLARWLKAHPHAEPHGAAVAGVVAFQFLVAVYGGYFGAGIGILMLASLGFMGLGDIHHMNAVKTLLAAVMNAVAVVQFVIRGMVVWRYALAMAAAGIAGGYLGARLARRTPPEYVRAFVIVVGFALAAYYFWKQLSG
jgi:uncharacterized protein